ncbi:unnamed protein product [Periconia digitata]|uniref:Uncharacterized protein n=1 Tax=Periconia digitata TaxID=1303443 RepID=A0A9W4UW07_9PLEO|nr:unnamed protein product [Periconia digitata]
MNGHRKTATLLAIAQILMLVTGVRGDCYALSGITALSAPAYNGPELVSCGRGTNNCCMRGQQCGSNLLCLGNGKVSREYCADRDWKGCSPLCPKGFNAGYGMRKCGMNRYCCSEDCNCDKDQVFHIDPLTGAVANATDVQENLKEDVPEWWEVDSSAMLSPTPTPTPAANSTSSTPPEITPPVTPSSATSSSESSGAPNASAPAPSTSPAGSPTAAPSSGLSGAAGVGIGLGAAAAVACLAGMIGLLVSRRKKRMERAKPQSSSSTLRGSSFGDKIYPLHDPSKLHEMDGVWPEYEIGGRQLPVPKHEIDGTQLSQEAIAKRTYLRV